MLSEKAKHSLSRRGRPLATAKNFEVTPAHFLPLTLPKSPILITPRPVTAAKNPPPALQGSGRRSTTTLLHLMLFVSPMILTNAWRPAAAIILTGGGGVVVVEMASLFLADGSVRVNTVVFLVMVSTGPLEHTIPLPLQWLSSTASIRGTYDDFFISRTPLTALLGKVYPARSLLTRLTACRITGWTRVLKAAWETLQLLMGLLPLLLRNLSKHTAVRLARSSVPPVLLTLSPSLSANVVPLPLSPPDKSVPRWKLLCRLIRPYIQLESNWLTLLLLS